MIKKVKVFVQTLTNDIELPQYAKSGDAGMDIKAAETIILSPSETKIIPTGLKVAIPQGYEIQVRPRSGLSFKTSLRIANSPGTIDSGYRDEIGIIVTNTSNNEHYTINKGDRIAQLVLKEVPQIEWQEVEDIQSVTKNGEDRCGGFGSTGDN